MDNIPPYPLYNSTFHVYRLSPLYHGETPLLEESTLGIHSRRLRDLLKGDNLRGVQVDFPGSENPIHKSGPLEGCEWDLLGDEAAWIDLQKQTDVSESRDIAPTVLAETARGIQIDLQYTKQTYSAFLLRNPETTTSPPNFTSLPLLLVRMPAPVREIVLNYLSTTFDTRISPLKLRPSFLTSVVESHLTHLTHATSTQSIPDIIKMLQLQLTFPASTTLLKNIDISIAREDVAGFLARGKLLAQQRQTRSTSDSSTLSGPFTTAFSHYTTTHLALPLSNPKIHISKIACGAFAIASEGKIKLFPPEPLSSDGSDDGTGITDLSAAERAMADLYTSLVQEASSCGNFTDLDMNMEDVEDMPTAKGRAKRPLGETTPAVMKRQKGKIKTAYRSENATAGAQRVGGDSIPAEPPPPYELHDPAVVSTM
ncbi:hypothetical protein K432DRAFT_302555 [Lepidopterella palustris CBS 459.81]|uniref:Uncharacterized protein n=1 Tax=Lepidopterella palustris CBS 459.81 TaxID=1314670 RepID=A0A8E2E6R1_9PEZI|nr:hypothetical protein K432DRAFT_302555 [Lepidopterella palustris CBS 459.81]